MSKPKVIAIVGPTASGKTSLSIDIAKQFNGEVISADSRQVYVGMDIGTGKVTLDEMDGVPHHLIDIVEPTTVYTGADFVKDASNAISEITNNDHVPVIAGGTFFYVDLLRGNISNAPVEPNPEFRDSISHLSTEKLFKMLETKDPSRALTIDSSNRRRLERALEIVNVIGKVPESVTTESPYEWLILGVEVSKEILHEKIHERLIARLDAGMIDEVQSLHKQGVSYERLESFGLEYRYIAQYLQNTLSHEDMVTTLDTKIRQYAKRQMTWLKRDTEIEWFAPENREAIFTRVQQFLHQA
jgi:tRNA dimethylallyltransferase